MWKLIKEILEYRREAQREKLVCNSCEILKHELAIERAEKKDLLNRILNPTSVPEKVVDTTDLKPINTGKSIPWNVRSQMLSAESRKEAQLIKQREEAVGPISVADLEKELNIVTAEREGDKDVAV